MIRATELVLISGLAVAMAAGSADAGIQFNVKPDAKAPADFEKRFDACIKKFKAAGGLARTILKQLNGAKVTVFYQKGGAVTADPSPGRNPAGKPIVMSWDSHLGGKYDDGAPKVPCAVLLHELQHAARYFTGKECNGSLADGNEKAYFYDEQMGARAENWWLHRKGKKQRKRYDFFGDDRKLDKWAKWPSSGKPPKAPRCNRCDTKANGEAMTEAEAAACRRCTGFHQQGCVDFKGGIYSGGDHREVANGSLKITVGKIGYCQDRKKCEFKNCVTCPHLDTAFPKGVSVTAVATPGKKSRFARWGPGACKGQGQVCSFIAKRDSCISAQFLLTDPKAPPQRLPKIPCD